MWRTDQLLLALLSRTSDQFIKFQCRNVITSFRGFFCSVRAAIRENGWSLFLVVPNAEDYGVGILAGERGSILAFKPPLKLVTMKPLWASMRAAK